MNINGKFISKHFVVTAIAPKAKIKHEKLLFKEGGKEGGGVAMCAVHEFMLFLVCILFCPQIHPLVLPDPKLNPRVSCHGKASPGYL